MASSENSRSDDLVAQVGNELRAALFPGAHLVLGLSGGIDSVTMLAVLSKYSETMRFSLRAVHVNHGISRNASQWEDFCRRLCASTRIPLVVEHVDISSLRHLGIEAAARTARYAAFARHAADFLVLAHHRDDQAETLLLQLLRGSGVDGLSGMAARRTSAQCDVAKHIVLRPLLGIARRDIEEYARAHKLEWVDDESNADTAMDRNFLRHRVLPVIEERFAHARAAMARSAAHLAEAAAVLGELGRIDLDGVAGADGLDISGLLKLGPPRAKNALRVLCRQFGAPVPGSARLEELWRQITTARDDRRPRITVEGWEFQSYRGRLYLQRSYRPPVSADYRVSWQGESMLPLLELGGTLIFKPEEGRGLSVEKLRSGPVTVRLRQGGERLRTHARRPRRTLKNLLQERGVPVWRRLSLPLVYCGETLVSVPGVGDESAWQAAPGERGLIVSWQALGQ